MKIKYICIFIIVLMASGNTWAQLIPENVFGLNNAPQRWGRNFDHQVWEMPSGGSLYRPSDAASLNFVGSQDTLEVILITDSGKDVIRWLRCRGSGNARQLRHMGFYGLSGDGSYKFNGPCAITVASNTPIYNPIIDRIFVANRLGHNLVILNFSFDPDYPRSDRIVFEDTIAVDSTFYPIDIEYIDFATGDKADNRIIALDDMNSKLYVFNEHGNLLSDFSLVVPGDTITSIYEAFAYKIIDTSTVAIYLADRNSAGVRLFYLSDDHNLTHAGYLVIGNWLSLSINDVVYDQRLGLWAIDSREPAFYLLSEDLSEILRQVHIPDFDMLSLNYPFKISILKNRIIIFENICGENGILSFAFNRPLVKQSIETEKEKILPDKFDLGQSYPNPFNSSIIIKYELPIESQVMLDVYDILGRKVTTLRNDIQPAGFYQLTWNAGGLSSGVYFCKLRAGDYIETKKMMLVK